MSAPTVLLDSARVLVYAAVDESVTYTGRNMIIVGGEILGQVPRLAICEDLVEGAVLLFHCDDNWAVLGATGYTTIDLAKQGAEERYSRISSKWQQYRTLSNDELAHIEQTRERLRALVAKYPIE